MKEVEFKSYLPGAIGRVVELHAVYYSQQWGFGPYFETKVASEMSEFVNRFDRERDGLWTVCLNGRVEGSIVIDGVNAATEGAHLRWFIVSSRLRGSGVGNELMKRAVSFCEDKGYAKAYLWTFEGLDAARHLYEKFGFVLVEEHLGDQWGTKVNEQRFILELSRRQPSSVS